MNEQREHGPPSWSGRVPRHSVFLSGRKTSVSLEEPFWQALRELATARGLSVSALISSIARKREQGNLSSALRVAVLEHFRAARSQASERGLRQQRPRVRSEDDKG
jgi:predicted DNA-binding ribbon-helix-helix protein